MTDDEPTTYENEPPKSESEMFYESLTQAQDYYGAPDRILQQLADSADTGGPGRRIPITLFLHGAVVTGHVTSSQEFYRAMASAFREHANAAAGGVLPPAAEDYARDTFERVAKDIDEEIDADSRAYEELGSTTARWILTRHLFLADASYTVPGQPPIPRDFVCVKLEQIAGWTFGAS
ncbi:hypothetical protein [Mycolicibacterium sp. 050158]|uniref:hypothetical protein n=1 Tax=Mycolicibacterium sp. 050158 TaxID=3090602 RepID=UPI00299E4023|nr:hypothetical protein [Mycolicibacterium sp. 050158]MDX1892992.1 hypothetical protein [Mycolicibacterium sp. 050158]